MYFITTIDSKDDSRRCVGYFSSFEDAEYVALHNVFDIYETCYDYLVIENIPEGLYQYDFNPVWYKYQKLTNTYERCERPSFVKAIGDIGYAIG